METVKVRYISDKYSIFFKKGEVYSASRASDDPKGLFWCFHIEKNDEPGDCAFPALPTLGLVLIPLGGCKECKGKWRFLTPLWCCDSEIWTSGVGSVGGKR